MNFITPHDKKARPVEKEDLGQVENDSLEMINLCFVGNGKYKEGHAIAHSQVSEDPLRFFVLKEGVAIINPEIINHTKIPVQHQEGCMSYPDRRMVIVPRWNKCIIKYKELTKNWELLDKEENLSGMEAFIFQHEIDHLNGIDIYHKEDSKELTDEIIGTIKEQKYKLIEIENKD